MIHAEYAAEESEFESPPPFGREEDIPLLFALERKKWNMIKEVIVVEGRDDTVAIRRAVEADTIETGGSAINQRILKRIALAQERRGVIVLTDPDHAGGTNFVKLLRTRSLAANMPSFRKPMQRAKGTLGWRMPHPRRSVMRWRGYILHTKVLRA